MKHYRIVRIVPLSYQGAILNFYVKNPGIHTKSYDIQLTELLQQKYSYTDSFSRAMRAIGNDAFELIYDFKDLQIIWAKEKNVKINEKNWQTEVILAQIKDIRPDIIFFQDIHSLPYTVRSQLKSLFPFVKLIVYFRGYPGGDPQFIRKEFGDADVLLVGSPILLEKCTSVGLKPYMIYHSFDDDILIKLSSNDNLNNQSFYDFTFLGSSGYGYGKGHSMRYWILEELIRRTILQCWLDERSNIKLNQTFFNMSLKLFIRTLLKNILEDYNPWILHGIENANWMPGNIRRIAHKIDRPQRNEFIPTKPLYKKYPSRCYQSKYGIEMYRILKQSKITLNIHSNNANGTVDNLRLFQATGVGTCLLTDTGANMKDLFIEDREIVTYSSIEECIEKVTYLLEHDDVRREIARAGQQRTLRDHTALNRCMQIDEILQKML